MPRLPLILYMLLSVAVLLAPFSTLHMHLASDHHPHDHDTPASETRVHGGHVHEFDTHQDSYQAGHVVDVDFALSDRSSAGFGWTDWLPILCALVIVGLGAVYTTLILRPPRPDPRPSSYLDHWRPPLRGPPLLSI